MKINVFGESLSDDFDELCIHIHINDVSPKYIGEVRYLLEYHIECLEDDLKMIDDTRMESFIRFCNTGKYYE